MDESLKIMIEMAEWIWNRFQDDLNDVTPEEADWRPLPQANNINTILRHLRIEAQWHLAGIELGEPMPSQMTPSVQQWIDSIPLDFEQNLKELHALYGPFLAALRKTTAADLQRQTALVYPGVPEARRPAHLLGFHQTVHLVGHAGQIRTLRNLYRKARGERARFFPDNPSFPA